MTLMCITLTALPAHLFLKQQRKILWNNLALIWFLARKALRGDVHSDLKLDHHKAIFSVVFRHWSWLIVVKRIQG